MAKMYKAPEKLSEWDEGRFKIFLAGSIEMGSADHWQERLANKLQDLDVVFLNPRRDDWDSSWVQSIDDPQFNEQVTWELDHIEKADMVVVVFDPDTKSPITLLELGKVTARNPEEVIVLCPEGFWRKGNVDIVSTRAGFTQVNTFDELTDNIREFVTEIFKFLKIAEKSVGYELLNRGDEPDPEIQRSE